MDEKNPAAHLDLRGVVCPINFVKTKLKLEEMDTGQVLEVIIDAGEPIANVPRSIKEEGHKIIKVDKVEGHFRLLIEKVG
ncbi:MAG: preprotein translocase subunit TatB [Omnitrophica WOR_2 bacterium RIFCSPHIGHO2_02_FULL_45_21]|nr:MAG: preprotein translocase subunit TatB [Omnitrophica WOR_2 bacterium RIFCSPHIGHO2_02_FULL_45_21]